MMLRVKRTILILSVIILGITPAFAQNLSRIAAVVNDDVISLFDLEQRISLSIFSSGMESRPEVFQKLAPQVLRNLIGERLKLQEAKKNKIVVGDDIIDRALKDIARRNKIPNDDMVAFLESKGIDSSTLKEQLRTSISWQEVINIQVRRRVKISEDDIDEEIAHIDANKGKPERLVSEIFFAIDDKKRETDIKQSADRLVQQIKGGVDFSAAAQQFSQSPTAAVGGDLGWVFQGQLATELESQLAHMNAGDVSDPIKTFSGYHILFVRDKRISGAISENETSVALEQVIISVPKDPTKDILDAKIAVANQVVASSNDCKSFADIGKQVGTETSGNLGTLKIGQLPPKLREKVLPLRINQASEPVYTPQGVVVLMVCDRKNPKEVNEITRRKQIKERILIQKEEMIARQLLRDLNRSAFIEIRL